MSGRIPPKGTRAYQVYYRDKRIRDEIKSLEERVRFMASDCDPMRQKCYDDAVASIVAAWEHVNEGWRK